MKNQINVSVIILFLTLLFNACAFLFKDDELWFDKRPYFGNDLRMNGYYYEKFSDNTISDNVVIIFFFSDGTMFTCSAGYSISDIQLIDKAIPNLFDREKNSKLAWGVFAISGKTIQYSGWGTSVGGGLPSFKGIGIIENDSTFRITKHINSDGREFEVNEIHHFRQFSPKPDSTNVFIK